MKKTKSKSIKPGLNQHLLNGVNALVDTVKVTLGPNGKLVMYPDYYNAIEAPDEYRPRINKDGYNCARQVRLEHPVERMASHIVLDASRINATAGAGDGSTSTLIMSQQIIQKGMELLQTSNITTYELKKELDQARDFAIDFIRSESIEITDNLEKLKYVASISANDESIGEQIYEIIKEIGIYGDIELKQTSNYDTELEIVKGLRTFKGWIAPFLCDDYNRMTWSAEDCAIVVFDGIIRTPQDIAPYLNATVSKEGKHAPLLVFADDVAKTALLRLEEFMQVSPRKLMIVEHDGFGERKRQIMQDICIFTGAQIVDEHSASKMRPIEAIGFCREASVAKEFTTIIEGEVQEELLAQEIEIIKDKLSLPPNELSQRERGYYERRLSNFTGGIALIHIGGQTKVEMEELYFRYEDAVLAVKAAIKEGVSIGGGHALFRAGVHLQDRSDEGSRIVGKALKQILVQLLGNSDANFLFPDAMTSALFGDEDKRLALDLIHRELVLLKEYRVYDATAVLVQAITNAVAVSKSILSIDKCVFRDAIYVNDSRTGTPPLPENDSDRGDVSSTDVGPAAYVWSVTEDKES